MGKMVSALRKIGVDYIFDTTFTADLTIMEEGTEFLDRVKRAGEYKWPMFISCCPGWLRFCKTQYPEYVENLSTAKSPQQMFGTMAKTYIAYKLGVDPDKIFSVSIMPCTAKKYERGVEAVNDGGHGSDVDLVLTTRELDRLIRTDGIRAEDLTEEPFDDFFGEGTGAGVIFGSTGGVMEAALRSAYYLTTGSNPKPDAFREVRGMDGWREAKFDLAGEEIRVAVVSGLGNTRKLLEAVKAGEVDYHFVEVRPVPEAASAEAASLAKRAEKKPPSVQRFCISLTRTTKSDFHMKILQLNLPMRNFLNRRCRINLTNIFIPRLRTGILIWKTPTNTNGYNPFVYHRGGITHILPLFFYIHLW